MLVHDLCIHVTTTIQRLSRGNAVFWIFSFGINLPGTSIKVYPLEGFRWRKAFEELIRETVSKTVVNYHFLRFLPQVLDI